ncbi:MAG: hypothetical protein AB7U20_10070 [Planctomycetaceae bacterium]
MAARRSKSKRASAANSESPSQPDVPVLFLDKCLGRYAVASALRAIGCQVEIHEDHFDHDAEDSEWLPEVGKRGWVILTKDKEITRNYIELCALLKSGAPSFVLKAQDMTGPQMAETFCKSLPQIRGCIKKSRS